MYNRSALMIIITTDYMMAVPGQCVDIYINYRKRERLLKYRARTIL